jgi:metal-responsive CopG/Arc/MetJ family transcriptional regulator
METVSVKFQEDVLKKIDANITHHNFNSRTEFIRDAIRDKLNELNKEELINEFLKFKGKSKKKTSYNQKTKSQELMAELDKRFN